MIYKSWKEMLYTSHEFRDLLSASDNFSDDINSNHRTRSQGESFATFIDKGSDALLRDSSEFVACLI